MPFVLSSPTMNFHIKVAKMMFAINHEFVTCQKQGALIEMAEVTNVLSVHGTPQNNKKTKV